MDPKQLLQNLATYSIVVASTLVCLPILVLLALLPPGLRFRNWVFYWVGSLWARMVLAAGFLRFDIRDEEQLSRYRHQPAIFVMNHLSALDIPLVERLLRGQPRVWLSNDYGRVPIFGFVLRRMAVVVKRSSVRSAASALQRVCDIAQPYGNHVLIFPEGTRHTDGQIHRFHAGFAVLADRLQRPVVPIFISGLHLVFPKGSWMIRPGASRVIVRIGQPLRMLPDESKEDFVAKVHRWFTLEREKIE